MRGFVPVDRSCALVDGQTVTMNAPRYNLKLVKNGSGQVFTQGLSDVPRDLSDTSKWSRNCNLAKSMVIVEERTVGQVFFFE